jgi:hypothetical protein
MTQDEIIEMAIQAGLVARIDECHRAIRPKWIVDHDITIYVEAFAKLVAEKEREVITDEYWSCVQSDLEHGVKSLNEEASRIFHISMPEVSKFGGWLNARGQA